MGKKTFKDNPALNFISEPVELSDDIPEVKAKAEAIQKDKIPEGYKVNPLYIEKRTRRVQLALQPSVYDKLKAKAEAKHLSVTEYITRLIESEG